MRRRTRYTLKSFTCGKSDTHKHTKSHTLTCPSHQQGATVSEHSVIRRVLTVDIEPVQSTVSPDSSSSSAEITDMTWRLVSARSGRFQTLTRSLAACVPAEEAAHRRGDGKQTSVREVCVFWLKIPKLVPEKVVKCQNKLDHLDRVFVGPLPASTCQHSGLFVHSPNNCCARKSKYSSQTNSPQYDSGCEDVVALDLFFLFFFCPPSES